MTQLNPTLFPVEFRELRERLFHLLLKYSYEWREEPFRLKSGAMSNMYVDCRMTTLQAEGSYLIGRLFHHFTATYAPMARGVGGLTMGADPIVCSVTSASYQSNNPLISAGYLVRGEAKNHGKNGMVVGPKYLGRDEEVVVVDDVITSGNSMLEATRELRGERGFRVKLALALVDRQEQDGLANIAKEVDKIITLFTLTELKNGQPDHVRFMDC